MELQDAPANYFFKLWPQIEANWKRIALGAGIIVVAAGLISFISWQRDQKEITAGKALTQTLMSSARTTTPSQLADSFLKIAADYHGTAGGQRALLQGAALLFTAEKYADAQAQFQKFLDTYPGSFFAAQAALGLATSLDAQGKPDLAASGYQRIINTYSDPVAVDSARFALAQIDERQGKLTEANSLYETIRRYDGNNLLGQESSLRLMELKQKLPAASPAAATTVPLNKSIP